MSAKRYTWGSYTTPFGGLLEVCKGGGPFRGDLRSWSGFWLRLIFKSLARGLVGYLLDT